MRSRSDSCGAASCIQSTARLLVVPGNAVFIRVVVIVVNVVSENSVRQREKSVRNAYRDEDALFVAFSPISRVSVCRNVRAVRPQIGQRNLNSFPFTQNQ